MIHYRALFEELLEVTPDRREPDVVVDVRDEERIRREA
jgi:hypothetical protein